MPVLQGPPPPPPPGLRPPPAPPSAKVQKALQSILERKHPSNPGIIARAATESKLCGILDLKNSGLAAFPIGLLKLTGNDISQVDLSDNQLSTLPKSFSALHKGTGLKSRLNYFLNYSHVPL
jgi:hypothetical protein